MNISFFRTSSRLRWMPLFAAAAFTAGTLATTGCSFDAGQSATMATSVPLAGMLHGGPNPVIGATVTLYATQSNGYGGAGLKLASTTTGSTGGFSFNPASYTCPAGQQAYITAAGGNTGGNTANANALLMAAVGPCSVLTSSTYIWIDEPSTVAAAYALGNFITISGSGATTVVNVSAPANNNATAGSCTGTGTAMACKAAGLAHAFLNAANLVNAVGTSSAPPNGLALASPASNSTNSLSNTTQPALLNVAPQQEINSLADSVESCINSSGVTGSGDTTSACGQLFTATTIPSTYSASTTYTTKPTNTLQALVNLAKFPFVTTTGVFNIASSNTYYLPTLTAAPADWSLAIIYRSVSNGTLPLGGVYYDTTDINDNVYTVGETVAATGSSTGATPQYVQSISSNGVGNWSAAAQITTSSNNLCQPEENGQASNSVVCGAATDTAGNLWLADNAISFTGGGLYQIKTASGAITQFNTTYASTAYYPFTVAVDANNDVFFSTANTASDNLFLLGPGSTSTTAPTPVTAGGVVYAGGHLSDAIAFDAAGDIFAPLGSGSNDGYTFIANTGTLSSEAFATAVNQCNCLGSGVDTYPTGAIADASGNFWMGNATNLIMIAAANAQTVSGTGSTGLTTVAITGASQLRIPIMDGAGNIFVSDTGTTIPVLYIYYPGLTTPVQASITGCNTGGVTGNAACITNSYGAPNGGIFYKSANVSIDSTGSAWLSSYGNDGVIQILGVAAPTWPQASYLHPATMPQ